MERCDSYLKKSESVDKERGIIHELEQMWPDVARLGYNRSP